MKKGNIYDFPTDKINIFSLVLDISGSMNAERRAMENGLEMYKESFRNFPEADTIAISVNRFDDFYYPSSFRPIEEFDTKYETCGGTGLYKSICCGADQLLKYLSEVAERNSCMPNGTFILFSDGMSTENSDYIKEYEVKAKSKIEQLNYSGVTTVFVAFGNAISSHFGKKLGFQSTIDVADRSVLEKFLGVELSNSCKEQSKSMKALGNNFFSKAISTKSDKYSQRTYQAIEDDNWFKDV